MSLNGSSFIASSNIAPSVFGGATRLGIGFWVYYTGRTADYGILFGNDSDYTTYAFSVKRYGTSGISLSVAIDETGVRSVKNRGFIYSLHGLGEGSWFHIFYDVNVTANTVDTYLNKALVVSAESLATTGTELWTPASPIPMKFSFKNGTWKFGDVSVWIDSDVPTATDAFDGVATDQILQYDNLNTPDQSLLPTGGDLDYVDDISTTGADLTVTSGSATVTSEVGEPTANLTTVAEYITRSGIIYRTEWKKGTSDTTIDIVVVTHPSFRLNGGSWLDCENYIKKDNKVFWVIPLAARPTTASDVVECSYALGDVIVSGVDFNADGVVTCTNDIGVDKHPLPSGTRDGLITNFGLYETNKLGSVNLCQDITLWIKGANFDSNGIPQNGTDASNVSGYLQDIIPAAPGLYTILWKGDALSLCQAGNGAGGSYSPVGAEFTTTGPDATTWRGRVYDCTTATPQLLMKTNVLPSYATGVTHIAMVKGDDLTQWQAGREITDLTLERLKNLKAIRFMDEMHSNSGNPTTEDSILPASYQLYRNQAAHNFSVNILAATPYTYADPATAFFLNGTGTLYKVQVDDASKIYTGMQPTFSGFTWTGGSMASRVWCVDADAPGLASDEVVIYANVVGTLSISSAKMLFGGTTLVAPERYGALFTENYDYNGQYLDAWLCRAPALQDDAWTEFLERLDASMPVGCDWYIEWANETWNTAGAFTNQRRVEEGRARLNGTTVPESYAAIAKHAYDLAAAVVATSESGRRVRMIVAGQSVNPSVVTNRLAAMRDLYGGAGETWDAADVIMSVSTYFNGVDWTTEADGIIAAGPLGLIDVLDCAYRDLTSYPAIKATYGKPLYAYEGGASWDTPSSIDETTTAVTRTVFAALSSPGMVSVQYGAFEKYRDEAGFDSMCVLAMMSLHAEANGKNWGTYGFWAQAPGIGDGSDGKYNNVADFDNYITNGADDSDFYSYVSPRGYAAEQWGQEDEGEEGMINTKEKRSSTLGVGRPWYRTKAPQSAKNGAWRSTSGNSYAFDFYIAPTWQIMVGETGKTLTIVNVQPEDIGRQFRCVVSGVGTATSNSADIVEL
jgi:hypothetical protein